MTLPIPNFDSPIDQMNYEQALSELESIVSILETGQDSLETSLAFYERGQALAKHCAKLLEQAELTIRQLSGNELPAIPSSISSQ